jgi:hypothetical protein
MPACVALNNMGHEARSHTWPLIWNDLLPLYGGAVAPCSVASKFCAQLGTGAQGDAVAEPHGGRDDVDPLERLPRS